MPVGIHLQKYALDLGSLQNISQIVHQRRDASCGLPSAVVTVPVLQKPHYGLKSWLAGFTDVWQEEMEPEGWGGVGAGWTLPAFLKCFLSVRWLMHVWSKFLLATADIQVGSGVVMVTWLGVWKFSFEMLVRWCISAEGLAPSHSILWALLWNFDMEISAFLICLIQVWVCVNPRPLFFGFFFLV